MRHITIGRTDNGRKPAKSAAFYAKRDVSGELGVGDTPATALANLELRETATSAGLDPGLAQEIAFLAIGAAGHLRDHPGALADRGESYLDLVDEVIRHAPMLSEAWERFGGEGFSGVWLYDVTERFGSDLAERLLSGQPIDAADLLQSIIDETMAAR